MSLPFFPSSFQIFTAKFNFDHPNANGLGKIPTFWENRSYVVTFFSVELKSDHPNANGLGKIPTF